MAPCQVDPIACPLRVTVGLSAAVTGCTALPVFPSAAAAELLFLETGLAAFPYSRGSALGRTSDRCSLVAVVPLQPEGCQVQHCSGSGPQQALQHGSESSSSYCMHPAWGSHGLRSWPVCCSGRASADPLLKTAFPNGRAAIEARRSADPGLTSSVRPWFQRLVPRPTLAGRRSGSVS